MRGTSPSLRPADSPSQNCRRSDGAIEGRSQKYSTTDPWVVCTVVEETSCQSWPFGGFGEIRERSSATHSWFGKAVGITAKVVR